MPNVVPLPSRLSPHFPDLTTGALNGKGLFDLLMGATKEHLMEEFNSQRLRGTDYSKVYLGSMESALANAVQYLVGVGLIDAQLDKIKAETELIQVQIKKEKELLPLQTAKIEAEIAHTKAQTHQIFEQIKLIPYEIDKIEADVKVTKAQVKKLVKDKDLVSEQIKEQQYRYLNILPKEKEMLDNQVSEIEYRVDNLLPNEKRILLAQVNKLKEEQSLLEKRTISEGVQAGVLAAQKDMLIEQGEAYQKEIDVKNAKLRVDAWGARAVANGSGAGGPVKWSAEDNNPAAS
jgi:chromosome segregation ATPase